METFTQSRPERFISDKEIADVLSVSRSWVRKQRHLRRSNQPHTFDLDPVLIGKTPRYKLPDFNHWLENL